MARQRGIVKLDGTLGDITFHKTQDGYMAKQKTVVKASRYASDPAYARTRENMAEFSRAGKAGKVLRDGLSSQISKVRDNRMTSRLTRQMMKVIKADTTSDRGSRNIMDGQLELLQGFEFNVHGSLSSTCTAKYTCGIDRATGQAVITVPIFVPTSAISAPEGTTHFRLFASGSEIDFENNTSEVISTESAVLPWDSNATKPLTLTHALTANSTHPLFLTLGIEFLQEVNGKFYPLKNGAFNSMAIVKVGRV